MIRCRTHYATVRNKPSTIIVYVIAALSMTFIRPALSQTIPKSALSELGATGVVKEICSAVFISHRSASEFLAHSSKFWMLPEDKQSIKGVQIDRRNNLVILRLENGVEARARFFGPQGCINLRNHEHSLNFTPQFAGSVLPSAKRLVWPMGNISPRHSWSADVDQNGIKRAVALAFQSDASTAAFLVLYKGDIIAEHYGHGISRDTALPGWSMTKSLQATWVGVLTTQGKLALDARVPVPEWQQPDDPRRDITLRDLLQMSAGLNCAYKDKRYNHFDYQRWRGEGYTDFLYIFTGVDDAYEYATSFRSAEQPGSSWDYTNCQPLMVGRVIADGLKAAGDSLYTWPQSALYDKLGIRSMVVETDRKGNLLTSAYGYATARDWARLGLLYQQEGVWNGEQLVSRDFIAFVRSPAPSAEKPWYGGGVWLNLAGDHPTLPRDTYSFSGIEGQSVFVVPSYDLVIVRLGNGIGDDPTSTAATPASRSVNDAAAALIRSIRRPEIVDQNSVENVIERFFTALERHDQIAFKKTVDPTTRIHESNGQSYTADELMKVNESSGYKSTWWISQPRFIIGDEVASVTYHNTGVFFKDGERTTVEWIETSSLRKEAGLWRIIELNSKEISSKRYFIRDSKETDR